MDVDAISEADDLLNLDPNFRANQISMTDQKILSIAQQILRSYPLSGVCLNLNGKEVTVYSKGSWFGFVIGGVIAAVGAVITPIAPVTGPVLIGVGTSMIGAAIQQTANEELNSQPSKKEDLGFEEKDN